MVPAKPISAATIVSIFLRFRFGLSVYSECGLTWELTGTQRHCTAKRTLTSTPRGAMLRVRVDWHVRSHAPEAMRLERFLSSHTAT